MTDDEIKLEPEWPDEASYEHMAAEVLTVGQVRRFLRERDDALAALREVLEVATRNEEGEFATCARAILAKYEVKP